LPTPNPTPHLPAPFLSQEATCSATYLRSLNALLALACLQLLSAVSYELQRRAWRRAAGRAGGADPPPAVDSTMRRGAAALAVVAALLPTHAFFGVLYYTDVASMAGLLLAQLLLLRGHRGWGAAAAAVGVRQTNAVWVTLMIGGEMLEDVMGDAEGGGGGSDDSSSGKATAAEQQQPAAGLRRRGGGAQGQGQQQQQPGGAAPQKRQPAPPPPSLLGELRAALPAAWRLRARLLARFWHLLLVPAAFAAFVVANKGITVGDREAHAPVLHLAQPMYLGSFALAAAGPLLAAPGAAGGGLRGLAAAAAAAPVAEAAAAGALLAAALAAAARGTLAHPYLLADNRHYTFYLWRRVMARRPAAKFALAPAHALGWRLLLRGLAGAQRRLWVAAYAAAAVLTLAPAWLLEFRYFTPGLLIALPHLWMPAAGGGGGGVGGAAGGWAARANAAALVAAVAGYAAVNAATLYVFLARPFTWPDGSVARFMW
jgi:alpha-1,2-glucosyltransferase